MSDQTSATPAPDLSPPKAPPRFVGGKPREQVVELDWPVEYDGKLYDRITVRRITVAELSAFAGEIAASESKDGPAHLPMFDAPPEVLDMLDPDDDDRLGEVVSVFLPRRLRQAAAQIPQDGAATSPSSPPSSDGAAAS